MRRVLDSWSLTLSNQSAAAGAGSKEGNLSSLLDGPLPGFVAEQLGRAGHLAVAVSLGVVLLLGSLNNLLVVLIFVKFPSVRTPINLILLNISLSDLLVCVFGTPLSFASSLRGRWLLGQGGCRWYGFANALFGIVSLVSLSMLSYQRYVTVLQKPPGGMATSYTKSGFCIAGSWLYSLLWTLPPLFGWSGYGPEGLGTTCSVTWQTKTANNISYVSCLFIFCLVLPLLAMIYCYGKILQTTRKVYRFRLTSIQKRENRILCMVVSMVSCYLLCWMPYGVVALIAMLGKPGIITPVASIVPSILAKASTMVNPILYILLNKKVKKYKIGSIP